jgi:hypothetical protein
MHLEHRAFSICYSVHLPRKTRRSIQFGLTVTETGTAEAPLRSALDRFNIHRSVAFSLSHISTDIPSSRLKC